MNDLLSTRIFQSRSLQMIALTALMLLVSGIRGPVRASDPRTDQEYAAETITEESSEPETDEEVRDPLASGMTNGRVSRGMHRNRVLHLTFDDGPNLQTTPAVLRHLRDAGVHATFFVVARQFDPFTANRRRKAALVKRIAEEGHTLGMHSYDHSSFTRIDDDSIREQLRRSEEVFEEVLGDRPHLFRPPFGHRNARTDRLLHQHGYTQFMWNMTGRDASARSADEVVSAFQESLRFREHTDRPGGIVLLHDTHRWTARAIPEIVAHVRARNCELLESDEELWLFSEDLQPFYQARTPGGHFARTAAFSAEELERRQTEAREAAEIYCE